MKILDVEAIGIETDDWVFGCSAITTYKQMRYWYVYLLYIIKNLLGTKLSMPTYKIPFVTIRILVY